jgi:hypothetical protein
MVTTVLYRVKCLMKYGSIFRSARADSRESVFRFGYTHYIRTTGRSPMDGGDGGALAPSPFFLVFIKFI